MMTQLNECFRLALLLLLASITHGLMADTPCTACHSTLRTTAAHPMSITSEGMLPSRAAPDCSSCHGESLEHLGNPAIEAPDQPFGADRTEQAADWNQQCIGCHTNMGVQKPDSRDCNACHVEKNKG